jgi:hypothetical protein
MIVSFCASPQETTNQDAPDIGADEANLSYPGSSVVAEELLGEVIEREESGVSQ